MSRLAAWIVAAGITLAGISAGYAQEVQVPLDQQGRLDQIDADLARRLGVLVDRFPDLVEARLFVRADDATIFFLEVVERRRGQLVRERVPMTPEEVARLRQQVSARLAERAPHVGLDQSGRTSLLIGTTTPGLGFYGWAVPTVYRLPIIWPCDRSTVTAMRT